MSAGVYVCWFRADSPLAPPLKDPLAIPVPPEGRPLAGDIHEAHQHPIIANVNQVVTATNPFVDHVLWIRPGNRAADAVGDGVGYAGEITQVGDGLCCTKSSI